MIYIVYKLCAGQCSGNNKPNIPKNILAFCKRMLTPCKHFVDITKPWKHLKSLLQLKHQCMKL